MSYTDKEAHRFLFKHIVTSDGHRGVVHGSEVSEDGNRIILYITCGSHGEMTDTEHAHVANDR